MKQATDFSGSGLVSHQPPGVSRARMETDSELPSVLTCLQSLCLHPTASSRASRRSRRSRGLSSRRPCRHPHVLPGHRAARGAAVPTVNTPCPSAPINPPQPPFAAGRGNGTRETNHGNASRGTGTRQNGGQPFHKLQRERDQEGPSEVGLQGLGFLKAQ